MPSQYRLPLFVAALSVAAILLWGWTVHQNDHRLAQEEQCNTARHLAGAIQGSIVSQISRGCIEVERIDSILANVRTATGLASLHLHVGDKPLASCCDGKTLPTTIHGSEGNLKTPAVFYFWQPLRLEDPLAGGRGKGGGKGGGMGGGMGGAGGGGMGGGTGGGGMGGGAGGGGGRGCGCVLTAGGSQIPSMKTTDAVVILGLPAETLNARLAAADARLLASILSGLFAVILFTTAWLLHANRQNLRQRLGELEGQKSRLEELQLIAAGVAHETKNPLGIIRSQAQRIENKPGVPAEIREMACRIVDEADVTTERLADFLNFAKPRDPKLRPIEALPTLERIRNLLHPDFEAAGVTFHLDCPAVSIEADPDLLSQILINLLMNSLQACQPGASVRIALQPAGRLATLRVEDAGSGIAPEALKDIFKPYVSGRSDGHGIGLSMVRRLAEAMGWQVEAASRLGQGTTMTIHHIKVHGA